MSALQGLLAVDGALIALSLAAIALASLGKPSYRFIYSAALVLSAADAAVALAFVLGRVGPESLTLPIGLPWIGAHFRLDALSAFFVALIGLGASAASLYAIGYGAHEEAPGRVTPFYPAFLAAMGLAPLADDAYMFLVSWEGMSLASWALVLSNHRDPENSRAAFVYLVMAAFGSAALLLCFGVLAGADGSYQFAAMRTANPSLGVATTAILLALVGAGSKAGLAPLHVWLPLAHPAAPSHVSGLMSGVMTKVAVYAFARIAFDLVGAPDWRWSAPVLIIGGVSGFVGVLHALMEVDLKRALAYSTIENLGLIFLGLGLALAFKADGMTSAAALALTAALLHALNHSLFKSLLFFGAGATLTATGSRDMGKLGGLLNRMPATGLFMLTGAAAISALPPLNGFVSEWLMLQAVLLGPQFPQWTLKLLAPSVGAVIALTAALAAACFIRLFGVSFLGRPRSPAAAEAKEVDRFSLTAMGGLALLCLIVGVLPGPVIDAMKPVVSLAVGGTMPLQSKIAWLSIAPIAEGRSSYNGLLVFLFMIGSGLLSATAIHRFASAAIRRTPAWDCGFPDANPATQYTAQSFSQPIRRVFGGFMFRARERVHMPKPGDIGAARLVVSSHDIIWEAIYAPLARAIDHSATRLNALQFLTIRQYLSIVFAALVALLVILAGAN
jgi:formate hydrogenlyase subunit 3/multisubunit Na+/H+ antiporter MnhD subunit